MSAFNLLIIYILLLLLLLCAFFGKWLFGVSYMVEAT